MTCIAAIERDGIVYMAGDTLTVQGSQALPNPDGKVYRLGEFVMGAAGDTQACRVIRYRLQSHLPKRNLGKDVATFMSTDFVDRVRSCLKIEGVLRRDYPEVLVGIRGEIWFISDDMHAHKCPDGYWAIGSGGDVAMGSLATLCEFESSVEELEHMTPTAFLDVALEMAEKHTVSVRGPFTHAHTDKRRS
jgi:ATP-dependent protease HslVU (ClpYQ) peptidase subunit